VKTRFLASSAAEQRRCVVSHSHRLITKEAEKKPGGGDASVVAQETTEPCVRTKCMSGNVTYEKRGDGQLEDEVHSVNQPCRLASASCQGCHILTLRRRPSGGSRPTADAVHAAGQGHRVRKVPVARYPAWRLFSLHFLMHLFRNLHNSRQPLL
jgi:hypothetical protein